MLLAHTFEENFNFSSVNSTEAFEKELFIENKNLSSKSPNEINSSRCLVDKTTVSLTDNKRKVIKLSREHACVRIQKCIAYLYNYFEMKLDCDLMRVVLHVLKDSRSYFCSLSQYNQIYFIKECFHPFLEVSGKISEYSSVKFQDCKLEKEEKNLVFIAYILIYAKEMHFLKIFECFEEYGAPTPNPHLSTSKKFAYFRNRKSYFYIGNDGYVSLNSISELIMLNNPNFSYWVNTACTSISKIPELCSVPYSGKSKQICSARTKKLLFENHNEIDSSDCLLDKTEVSLIGNNAGIGNLSREYACGRIHACIAYLYKYFEIELDSLLLRVVLHILEDCKLYFCNLPEFDQVCFIEDCFHNFIRNEKKVLEYFSVKGRDCKLSREEKNLVFIAYILTYAKEMHFLKIFGCFEEYGAASPNPHLNESGKFSYFRNRKKYFHIGNDGYVILNDVSELNVLNSIKVSNFFDSSCKRNPPVSPVDSGTCLSPVSCEQEEKQFFSTNISLSIAENITDLCVKILSNSNQMHFEKICKILTCNGSEEIQSFIQSLSISEKLDFFKNASDKFEIEKNGFVTLKTSIEPLNASTCIENHEKYISVDFKTQGASEGDINVLPSCSQLHISSPLTKDEENGKNNAAAATPFISCEPLRSCVSSKENFDQGKGINTVSFTNVGISKNSIFKKEKPQIYDSSNYNNHSVTDKHVLPNLQEHSSKVTERGKMRTNFPPCLTDEVKQNKCSEIIDISKDIIWNGKSLKDEHVNCSTADENPSDSIAVKKSVKINSFSAIIKDKITSHDKVDEKLVSVRNTTVLKPCKTLYTWSAKHCDLKENITSSYPVPSSSSNCKNEPEHAKSLETLPSNEVKNSLYPCDISTSATHKSQDALSNISPSIIPDYLSESNQTFSNVSIPAVEKRISHLQKLPEQSPTFLKYPKSVNKLSISRPSKAARGLTSSTVSSQYSNCLTDNNFKIIKPQSFSFDDESYNEYCSEILNSFLGPLNSETGKSVTSNTLKGEELVNHDVSLCVKEVEELDNFTLNISKEENIFAKSFFPASNIHKHADKELQAINFFTVVLGKYSSGLSLQMLYIHLKTASREVIEYLNNCYEHNLLHFFCANKKHFYVSPISHNVYLRK
ncbi:uncharacterized protein LOC118202950 [Stegodyphus dumicola]|uniref:uncharacterized protein LOC118202950 n=1 Tax=Stegodyphus dumicola TaxID=202533 RepID=UPI0015B250EA|nr:uncharacterized protein LOC118202950 [Stegodyphus dumicola]XP_035231057.1 uncharacterized protein LOC118202950 [Stegodyphus dumicola]XP_035231058.1 uncharacterized protein LOC118202950 [Stegodyphus dumicola]XP_035231059.1 uncharacterized protein LOC118202950 [Stegodyphus dumicola]XP_035231060.1 uncharacterized protein LOC118202950 [Stegodyphus dumicola]XP_035231062.1 uncharacterized protein LOC118202950 [Stegodyphus dumicola]